MSSKKQKAVIYGEAPEWQGAGQDFLDWTRQGLAGGYRPGASELQSSLGQYQGLFGQSNERLREMMSPGYLTGPNPALEAWGRNLRERQAIADRKRQGNLIMRFGSAGHTMSSPMLSALEQGQREADLGVEGMISQAGMEELVRREAAQQGAVGASQQNWLRALGMTNEQWQDLVNNLLQYMQGGKGQLYMPQGGGGGGGLLGTLLKGGVGFLQGGWPGAAAGVASGM